MKYLLLFALIFCSFEAIAQERETILDGDMEISYFGGLNLNFASVMSNLTGLIGGQAGVLINDAIYLGGALGSSITEIGGGYTSYRYAGLLLGSFVKPNDAIHYFADVGLYSGKISSEGLGGIVLASTEKFSIIEPRVGVGINLNDKLKAIAGLSYKLVGAIDNSDITKKDIGGFSISASIIYGL
tara:strand:+ start:503 stop:1057 length:555 start_codon:yes stop_codon:yes gene_type:complete